MRHIRARITNSLKKAEKIVDRFTFFGILFIVYAVKAIAIIFLIDIAVLITLCAIEETNAWWILKF